jgi:hypothetical protein
VVAGTLDEVVEACAFAAEDEDAVAGEIEPIIVRFSALVEADDPEVLLFEFLERADEVDYAGYAEMFGCTSAGFYSNGAEWGGTALGEYDAIDSCAIGYAKQGAEVLRVFDTVKGEDEAWLAGLLGLE